MSGKEETKTERVKSVVVEWRGNDNSPNDDFPFSLSRRDEGPKVEI